MSILWWALKDLKMGLKDSIELFQETCVYGNLLRKGSLESSKRVRSSSFSNIGVTEAILRRVDTEVNWREALIMLGLLGGGIVSITAW